MLYFCYFAIRGIFSHVYNLCIKFRFAPLNYTGLTLKCLFAIQKMNTINVATAAYLTVRMPITCDLEPCSN